MTNERAAPQPPASTRADWEKVEDDYRSGIKTLREIASEHGLTEGAIRKRAKRDEWTRDLTGKIRRKTEELVRKNLVRKNGTQDFAYRDFAYREKEIIAANAECSAAVVMREREDIQKAVAIAARLMAELEHQSGAENAVLLSRLGEIIASNGESAPDAAYQKIISLPERARTMKSLADSMKTLIDLERRVLKLDDAPESEKTALVVKYA